MATLSGFRSAFPECDDTATDLQVKVALRDTLVSADAWGDDADTVIYLTIATQFPPSARQLRRYMEKLDALGATRQATHDGITEARLDTIQDTADAAALAAEDAQTAADAAQADATQALSDAADAQADADALDTRLDTAEATLVDHESRIVALEPP